MALIKHSSMRQMVVVDLTNDTDDDEDEEPIAFASQAVAPSIVTTPLPSSFGLPAATTFVPRLYSTDAPRSIPLQRPCPSFVSQRDNSTPNSTIPRSYLSPNAPSDNTAIHGHGQWTEVSQNHVPIPSTSLVHGIKNGVSPERPAKKMRTMMSHGQALARLPQNRKQDNVIAGRIQGQDSFVQPGWIGSTAKETDGLESKGFPALFKSSQNDDEDSLLSYRSSTLGPKQHELKHWNSPNTQPALASVPEPNYKSTVKPPKSEPVVKKSTQPFTTAQDHYLIFLKEVKQYTWKEITVEFNKEFPRRPYHGLQFRYSSYLNKRDRSQDPTALTLPARFASDSAVDWQHVHSNHPGLRATSPTRPILKQSTKEQFYDLGVDASSRRDRSHRTNRVNYTWPRRHRSRNGTGIDGANEDKTSPELLVLESGSSGSVTSSEEAMPDLDAITTAEFEPISVDHVARNAGLALCARNEQSHSKENLPYISRFQRSKAQAPSHWDWDRSCFRQWQGSLIHVDFSPDEIELVKRAITKLQNKPRLSRHSTQRRQLRELLKTFTSPQILHLVANIQRRLPGRDKASITAFLQDAKAGDVADAPQIASLTAARPQRSQTLSTSHIIRQREIGSLSHRGWREASTAITYRIKNQVMDTMGPAACWTGASSDVHVVAWAPNGESFAAGAVAVDDPDSMQYNRPNNLLYGNVSNGTIHELGEHTKDRKRTESGANASHAMFASQDPKLYTTVSSVAFSTDGKMMYSAGYDGTICVWHPGNSYEQPILGSKLNARAKIDLMTVNRNRPGVIATAAKISKSKAVRLLAIDQENPSNFTKHSFHSSKAVSRSDLKILPTALQFEPTHGRLLLAGFGANLRDQGFDITGDLCLWDVETLTQMQINGSNKNIFDIEFNLNRLNMPLFAIGCVAGGNVNRGTRSLVRLYDERGLERYGCPVEIECKALDMNEICWSPYDEYIIAAGCTNGRSYVWDLRWHTDPIRTLVHGKPLMPLQEGVPHEVTDTGVRFLSWGENATRLYSGSSDGMIKIWDVTRSEEDTFVKDLVSLDSGIMSGAFSPGMSKLVVGEVNGSVNVLEVGRNDCSIKDATKLRYMPYDSGDNSSESTPSNLAETVFESANSGVAEGNHLVQTQQVQVLPMGGFPIRQVVQGPHYTGPFDESVDAPFLREQALEFQRTMGATPVSQCNISACKATPKVTGEDVGDSGRSQDRIPDELRRQWKSIEGEKRLRPGKTQCTYCSRPARPLTSDLLNVSGLCERCSFACFRCGSVNPIAGPTTRLICGSCAGVWDMGSLGYECVQPPTVVGATPTHVSALGQFGKEASSERAEDADTSFGDEMNALTDYYFSLAVDRPHSPPL